jgi:hypothetical protein
LPIEDTVTSIVCPSFEKAGSCAWTMTAATFFSCGLMLSGSTTPSCASMLFMLWIVNWVCEVWSPVPFRPTTRP